RAADHEDRVEVVLTHQLARPLLTLLTLIDADWLGLTFARLELANPRGEIGCIVFLGGCRGWNECGCCAESSKFVEVATSDHGVSGIISERNRVIGSSKSRSSRRSHPEAPDFGARICFVAVSPNSRSLLLQGRSSG